MVDVRYGSLEKRHRAEDLSPIARRNSEDAQLQAASRARAKAEREVAEFQEYLAWEKLYKRYQAGEPAPAKLKNAFLQLKEIEAEEGRLSPQDVQLLFRQWGVEGQYAAWSELQDSPKKAPKMHQLRKRLEGKKPAADDAALKKRLQRRAQGARKKEREARAQLDELQALRAQEAAAAQAEAAAEAARKKAQREDPVWIAERERLQREAEEAAQAKWKAEAPARKRARQEEGKAERKKRKKRLAAAGRGAKASMRLGPTAGKQKEPIRRALRRMSTADLGEGKFFSLPDPPRFEESRRGHVLPELCGNPLDGTMYLIALPRAQRALVHILTVEDWKKALVLWGQTEGVPIPKDPRQIAWEVLRPWAQSSLRFGQEARVNVRGLQWVMDPEGEERVLVPFNEEQKAAVEAGKMPSEQSFRVRPRKRSTGYRGPAGIHEKGDRKARIDLPFVPGKPSLSAFFYEVESGQYLVFSIVLRKGPKIDKLWKHFQPPWPKGSPKRKSPLFSWERLSRSLQAGEKAFTSPPLCKTKERGEMMEELWALRRPVQGMIRSLKWLGKIVGPGAMKSIDSTSAKSLARAGDVTLRAIAEFTNFSQNVALTLRRIPKGMADVHPEQVLFRTFVKLPRKHGGLPVSKIWRAASIPPVRLVVRDPVKRAQLYGIGRAGLMGREGMPEDPEKDLAKAFAPVPVMTTALAKEALEEHKTHIKVEVDSPEFEKIERKLEEAQERLARKEEQAQRGSKKAGWAADDLKREVEALKVRFKGSLWTWLHAALVAEKKSRLKAAKVRIQQLKAQGVSFQALSSEDVEALRAALARSPTAHDLATLIVRRLRKTGLEPIPDNQVSRYLSDLTEQAAPFFDDALEAKIVTMRSFLQKKGIEKERKAQVKQELKASELRLRKLYLLRCLFYIYYAMGGEGLVESLEGTDRAMNRALRDMGQLPGEVKREGAPLTDFGDATFYYTFNPALAYITKVWWMSPGPWVRSKEGLAPGALQRFQDVDAIGRYGWSLQLMYQEGLHKRSLEKTMARVEGRLDPTEVLGEMKRSMTEAARRKGRKLTDDERLDAQEAGAARSSWEYKAFVSGGARRHGARDAHAFRQSPRRYLSDSRQKAEEALITQVQAKVPSSDQMERLALQAPPYTTETLYGSVRSTHEPPGSSLAALEHVREDSQYLLRLIERRMKQLGSSNGDEG